jgi:hypothetical protein
MGCIPAKGIVAAKIRCCSSTLPGMFLMGFKKVVLASDAMGA